jgi:hypothetical protein
LVFTASHKARQVRLALDHCLGREPVRPFFHVFMRLMRSVPDQVKPNTDAVANCMLWSIVK